MRPDLVFGDVVLRRGVHIMVVDPKPAEKKGDWGQWIAGIRLNGANSTYGLRGGSAGVGFYNRAECKKVEP